MSEENILNRPRVPGSIERIILWTVIFLLALSNLATVSNKAYQEYLYGLLSHIPYDGLLKNSLVINKNQLELESQNLRQKYKQLNNKLDSHKVKANTVSKSVIKRSARNAAKNVTSVFGEAVPYLGTALIISVTANDLVDACDTIRDMNEMATFFETEADLDQQDTVCGTTVPGADEIMASIKQSIGTSIDQAHQATKDSARDLYDAIGGTMYQLLEK